ncbi:PREDICTED: uncharacterized protein LOC104804851 [Tarenaya hassleriana]|uniref:uncharacterized protein LOC104804851 n=1 Tax=Tarenaya hassleriana TaxID=28532 RepID=UPI00053CAA47|nr:PREDICTED: uncharacterized protein LOC104804851 [Tarenaya hassleriana]
MGSGGASMNIRDHGVSVDKKKGRVGCNYCGKEMSGFTRLKCHLAGIRKDVVPCEQVPDSVRAAFRYMLEEGFRPTYDDSAKSVPRCTDFDSSASEDCCSHRSSLKKRRLQTDKHDLMWKTEKKCIGRFFYENCVDFSVVESLSFRQMLSVACPGTDVSQLRWKIPTSEDLNGWILTEEVKEMEEHVKRIKDSWEVYGCSILLDAWVDVNGRDLVTFLADCPKGAVYLKSCDVSGIKDDIIALVLLMDGIVAEVGVHNVVQIIGCSTSGWVGELHKWFAGNHREIFWSVSVSHCFELMLDKIRTLDFVTDVLEKVRNITEFIHSDPSVLKLFRDHNHGQHLTLLSKNNSAKPYMTLESTLMARESFISMFTSSDWKNLKCASRGEGIRAAKLVEDSSFWKNAETVLECTIPLVRALFLVTKADKPQVGLIYDTMDEIKEGIRKNFNHKKLSYKTVWDIIDEVWDTHLHTSLHAAGYFLNPCAFYSTDFHLDPEVTIGLVSSLIHMVKERSDLLEVLPQLDMYRLGKDSFSEASRSENISRMAPAEWWIQYGNQCPELQSVAIKILSQTCEGASRFGLKREVAEKLLAGGKSPLDHPLLKDFVFVHYNLHLRGCNLIQDSGEDIEH